MGALLLASTAGSVVSSALTPAITVLALLSSILCTLFIIIGGYQYITSSGHPERLSNAKKLIRNALIGLVIVLSAAFLAHLLQSVYGPVAGPPTKSVVPTLNSIKTSSSSGIIGVIIKVITGVLGSLIQTVASPFLKALGYFTSGTPLAATNHSVFDLWVSSVGIADALMVLVLVIIGLHTMGYLSLGMEEIDIRHILPQVGLTFVLINSSIFIIDAFIDLSNLLIRAIGGASAVHSVWQSLSNVLKQPSAYDLAALIIMTIFLVFSVILIIYYVGRIVTIYLGAVLAPIVILCWLVPSLRDMAISASKRYFSAIFVLFIHVIILELAASLLAGMTASSQNSSPDPLMSMIVGLATLIALLKTQGVMNQLSYATIGPRMTRRIAERLVSNVSYLGSQASSFVGGFLPGHSSLAIDSARDYSLRQDNVINRNQANSTVPSQPPKPAPKPEEDKKEMKVTAIPAQITTIEDHIAGNLNLTQLLLLAAPLFLTAAIFFLLPPFGSYALYKVLIAGVFISVCSLLALRIGDKIMLDLLRLRAGYEFRPHIYTYQKAHPLADLSVADKNSPHRRTTTQVNPITINLTPDARFKSLKLLQSRQYAVSFESRAGGLVVKVNIAH